MEVVNGRMISKIPKKYLDEERSQLFREYRILRSQLSKLLEQNSINNGIPSWNAQILERLNNGERNIINNTSKYTTLYD